MNNAHQTLHIAIAALLATAALSPAQAKQRTLQLAEDGAITKPISTASTPLAATNNQVCHAGAKWLRLGFKGLQLSSYDSLTLSSSGGDTLVLEGTQWNERSFSTKALRGECVTLTPSFGSPDSKFALDSYQAGALALEATTVVVAGAGDICDSSPADCGTTGDSIVSINPDAVFTAGDNAYSNGALTEYNTRYEPNWGAFKSKTHPTPGNHDYNTANASGYFDYFNGSGVQNGIAGDRSKGYYSWDVGDWHFVALNTQSGGTVATAQVDWLTSDLAATTKPCVAAYFHHPLVSRGNYSGYSQVKPFVDALYAAHADLVLVGHDHNYQRYAKMNGSQQAKTDGLRQILVGTGGRDFYSLSGTHSLLEESNDDTWGVLKLTLTSTGYTGDFVRSSGGSFTDSFSGTCNAKGTPPVNTPPVANFTATTSNLTATFSDSSTDSDGSIASRSWSFGDATSSTATNPAHTYTTAGTYNVTLTVTDNGGASHSVTKPVTVTAASGNVLGNGVAVSVSGKRNQEFSYTANLAAGASNLVVTLSGGTGNADLYVKFGSAPSTTSYDCRSANAGNTESCSFAAPSAGTWYIKVRGAKNFSGASLKATWTP